MNQNADLDYFKATPVSESARAIQVTLERNGETYWIPKSLCEWHHEGILMVESWFAEKEELGT